MGWEKLYLLGWSKDSGKGSSCPHTHRLGKLCASQTFCLRSPLGNSRPCRGRSRPLLKAPATLPAVSLKPRPLRGTNSFFPPQVDTASEVEELEVDSVSLLPAAPESHSGGARIQVFLARYRWVPLTPSATLRIGVHGEQVWMKMETPGHSRGRPWVPAEPCTYSIVEARWVP